MKAAAMIITVLLADMLAGAPTTAPSTEKPIVRPSFRERYSILSDHNIFMRERRSARDRDRSTTQPSFQRTPEQTFVLTGIVLEAGQRRAYMEDRERGGLIKLSIGDTIARGKIADIDIDAVAYEQNGRQQWVAIGTDLTGATPPPPAVNMLSPTTGPTTLPFDPNSPDLTVEQKMQLRRFQELNKK
jgi:hypothetical protein